jgi:putative DNA primase/helicase
VLNRADAIRGTDEGIWRRVRLVPFTVQIPEAERDRQLPAKLTAELGGILNWAIAGCLAWRAEGLTAPERCDRSQHRLIAADEVCN